VICCLQARAHRGLDGFSKPKAIGDAPAGRGPFRARAMGLPKGWSKAEDGGAATFLSREE